MSRYIYRMILTLMLTVASNQAIASRPPAEINFGVGDTVDVETGVGMNVPGFGVGVGVGVSVGVGVDDQHGVFVHLNH